MFLSLHIPFGPGLRGGLGPIRIGLALLATTSGVSAQPPAGGDGAHPIPPLEAVHPQAPLERAGFERFTSHDELVRFLVALGGTSPDMTPERYGRSVEGRELPAAVFGRVGMDPAEAHRSGRAVVVLGANAHGYNYLLRESLLLVARELATPGTSLNALLDHLVVVVVPSMNPDGAEAGTRPNAAGSDLNRDYMMLDQPETAAYVAGVLNRWNPHLVVDGHDGGAVQYGGAYPYTLLFQGSGLAGADPALTELADREIFPRLREDFRRVGLEAFYWARGDGERWYGGGAAPRMGRNHGGLANRVTILFELAEWHPTREAVEIGVFAFRTLLEVAAERSEELERVVTTARAATVEAGRRGVGEVPVRETMAPEPFRVSYQMRDPEGGDGPIQVEDAELVKRPVATRTRALPYAYLLPPEAGEAVAVLERQGIHVERLQEPARLSIRRYTLAGLTHVPGDNGNRAALQAEVGEERDGVEEVPRGSWVIRTGQPLGRVAAHLLEPETGDGLLHWNRLTSLLPLAELEAHLQDPTSASAPLLPMFKLMEPRGLPTMRVR